MLHGRVITSRRRDLDVADIDRGLLAPEIDVQDVDLDVGVVDLPSERRGIDCHAVEPEIPRLRAG